MSVEQRVTTRDSCQVALMKLFEIAAQLVRERWLCSINCLNERLGDMGGCLALWRTSESICTEFDDGPHDHPLQVGEIVESTAHVMEIVGIN